MMAVTIAKVQRFGVEVIGLQTFPIFCGYLLIIMLSGVWQKLTRPLHLRPILILYNFLCCIISLYTFVGFVYGLQQSDSIFQKESQPLLKPFFYMYWLTKILELLDTIFMILRHKQRQISFLHIYHHASMILLSDYAYHYSPWPAIVPFLGLNSLVHVMLYSYYGLTAYNPSNPPAWKQRCTEFQILQFLIDFVVATIGYLYHGYCVYGLFYGLIMTGLFCNFYYHAYLKKRSVSKKSD